MLRVRDLVLQDPVALDKWPMIVDRIVEREDDKFRLKNRWKDREYGETILESLNIWNGYTDLRVDLVKVLVDHGLKALADQIVEEGLLPRTGTLTSKAHAVGIWFEVGEVVYNFTGRETELIDLHHMLTRARSTESVAANIISICGLGGIGKSSLAKKYAFRYKSEYDGNVIWINAETIGSVRASFMKLAKLLKISVADKESNEDVAAKVYETFSNKKSLFIFDNVEEKSDFKQFQPKIVNPSNETPHILTTTRRNDVTPILKNQLSLDVLKLEEAVELIIEQLPYAKESSAIKLAEKLQRLPLALQQALAYVRDKYLSDDQCIRKYLEEFKASERSLLDDERFKENNDYSRTTFTTWSITLKRIHGIEGGDWATRIIEVLAYLNPDLITVQFVAGVAAIFDNQPGTERGLKLLERFSMISLQDGKIRIHRLVQHVIRLSLSSHNEKDALKLIIRYLHWKLSSNEFNNETRECTSHGVHLFPFQAKHNELLKGKSLYLEVLCYFLLYYGNYSDCLTIAAQSSSMYEVIFGDTRTSLRMKLRMGDAHFHMKNFSTAMEILENIVQIFQQTLGQNSYTPQFLTISVLRAMADIHSARGDNQKAITIYNEIIPAVVRLLGVGSHIVWEMKQAQARALRKLGRLDETSKLLLAVYQKRLELHGENDLRVLDVKGDMGDLAFSKGDLMEAVKIWTEVYNGYKHVAGDQHPEAIDIKSKIAEAETELSRLQLADDQTKESNLNVFSSN